MSLIDLTRQSKTRSAREVASFKLAKKFSTGVWYYSPGGGRFHDRYVEPYSIEERLEIAASLKDKGISALEAHYPNEINEENIELYRKVCKTSGLRLLTVIPNLFYDKEFKHGSLSSPDAKARTEAIRRARVALQLNKELDTDFAVVWPGIDGYEIPFGHDFFGMWQRFEEGLAEALDEVPGVRIALEPKPYEPRGNNIYRNTADGVLAARRVENRLKAKENQAVLSQGNALVALNPEVGHVLMGFEDLTGSLALVLSENRLAHTHWNSQPLGNYDQDLNVGSVSPEQAFSVLFLLREHKYEGYFGIDINPERQPVQKALTICMNALSAMIDKVNSLTQAQIEKIFLYRSQPEKYPGCLEQAFHHLTLGTPFPEE